MRLSLGLALLMLVAGFTVSARAQEALQLHEQEIEAGLIYNFLKYITWPSETSRADVAVCVYGEDSFINYLQLMAGRTVNQRRITVRSARDFPAAESCDLLFINTSGKDQWPQMMRFLRGKPVLTVSTIDGFTDKGGMIEFGRKGSRIQVLLNVDAAQAARLHVEDRLLKLVTVTHAPLPDEGR
ncbi:MAG: YfiR family protein [Alphaproteobacteria bacterium]|nr:YfiR family protein [Alphaproteobacteria bacterium]